jgi:radical SAM-linked protein
LGYTSEYELADIWLLEEVDPHKIIGQIMSKMAPGITITAVEQVPLDAPSLQSVTASAVYDVMPFEKMNAEELSSRASRLLAEESLIRERKSGKGKVKQYNLRPLIIDISTAVGPDGNGMLKMTLFLMEGKTGRPDEVLGALELDPLASHIHRTLITLRDE